MAETEDPGDIRPLPEGHHGGGGGGGVNLGTLPPGHTVPPGFGGVLGYGGFYTPSRLADILGQRRRLMQGYGVQGPSVSTTSPASMGFSVASPGTSYASAPAQGGYGGPMGTSQTGGYGPTGYGAPGSAYQGQQAGPDPAAVRAWVARLRQLQGMGGNLDRRGQIEVGELAGRLHTLGLNDYGQPTGDIVDQGLPPPGFGASGPSGTDPFGFSAFTSDRRNDVAGLINRLFGYGGQAGAFDPLGSDAVASALQQRAQGQAARDTAQAQRAAQYYAGSDPAAAGYAGLQSYLGGLRGTADAVNNARLQTMLQGQNYARNLLSGAMGFGNQWQLNQQQGNIQSGLQPDYWAQAAGGLGGGILGGLLGGG